jgi:tRNA(His) guanylyltransferase
LLGPAPDPVALRDRELLQLIELTRLSNFYQFEKPNDVRALNVMNEAARSVMNSIPDVTLAYGDSDEYSFVLKKSCQMFERREAKLVSTFASTFTAFYIEHWGDTMEASLDISHLPTFDARAVTYPLMRILRDYLSWRQADCHINNLYNTTFWALVLKGHKTPQEAEKILCGTVASTKNEILFSQFGINYNNEPEMFKKGTILIRDLESESTRSPSHDPGVQLSERQQQRAAKRYSKAEIQQLHVDIIGDAFWKARPWLAD